MAVWRLRTIAVIALLIGCTRSGSPSPQERVAPETATAPDSTLALTESQREFLWQVEHHGLVLSRYGFPTLAASLSKADRQALIDRFAPDFTGSALREPRLVSLCTDFADVVRQEETALAPEQLTREQFVDRLLDFRKVFLQPPKVNLALMALSPVARQDLDGLWRGTCQLRMWGQARPGQPAEVVLLLRYELPRPTKERLGSTGWLGSCAITQSQIARAPHFLMREVTAQCGIDTRPFHDNWAGRGMFGVTGGVYVCDYDRDGILDLLITDVRGYALYKGLPEGKFKNVTAQLGLPPGPARLSPLATVAAFVDLDGDGWEDLILGNRIYRNDRGRVFVDMTERTNLRLPLEATGVAIADFDRDGRVDLYVTHLGRAKTDSWLGGKSGSLKSNLLWRNLGNWQFEDVTHVSGAAGGERSSFCAAWLDANNDGWPDLYVLNEFGNGVLLLNQGNGTFQEQQLIEGLGDFGSMGVTCGDFDNDGNIDLYVANMYSKAGNRVFGNVPPGSHAEEVMAKLRQFTTGSQLYHNLGCRDAASPIRARRASEGASIGQPRFEALGQAYQVAAVGWSHGAVMVDLDNDGWLDLYSTAGYTSQSRDEPDG